VVTRISDHADINMKEGKHYPNVYVDMCWAWILDPVESIQFLRSFLMSVPKNKLFAFGGDYFIVEPIAGHAHLARLGIARALTTLVDDGLIRLAETPEIIDDLMRGNALSLFGTA
jgi:predicted TIM-barrel fold metal-dependent hydrolase